MKDIIRPFFEGERLQTGCGEAFGHSGCPTTRLASSDRGLRDLAPV